jgi:hypothetical protein
MDVRELLSLCSELVGQLARQFRLGLREESQQLD